MSANRNIIKFGNKTVRRNLRTTSVSSGVADEKKVQEITRNIGGNLIGSMSEVNMFLEGGEVVSFKGPRVYTGKQSSFFGVVGEPVTKKLDEMLPQIIPQLDMETVSGLKNQFESEAADSAKAEGELEEVVAQDESTETANENK